MSDSDTTMINKLSESSVPKFLPTFRLQWEEAQKCYVVLYPEGMVKLNQSAGEIMKRCDGKASLGDIVSDLATAFDCDRELMLRECSSFITHAMQRGWLGV